MSGPESKLWGRTKRAVTKGCEALGLPNPYLKRVENTLNNGHPDVEFVIAGVAGAIELKVIEGWPKRARTPVRLRHYTEQQREDLRARLRAGGWCFFLLWARETDEYLLYKGQWSLLLGTKNQAVTRQLAERVWHGAINGRELVEELRG